MNISKEQYKLLKKIAKYNVISTSQLSAYEKEACIFLEQKGFLLIASQDRISENGTIDIFHCYPTEYKITQARRVEIYAFKSTFYKWWIPLVISVIAILVSIVMPIIQFLLL